MEFTDLPSDIWSNIAEQLSPEDMARFFAVSKAIRNETYPEKILEPLRETKERVLRERFLRQRGQEERKRLIGIVEDELEISIARKHPDIYGQETILAAKPNLAILLSDNFPRYKGQTLVTPNILFAWFQLYAYLNDLTVDTPRLTFRVDKTIAALVPPQYNWNEGDIRNFHEFNLIVFELIDLVSLAGMPNPQEIRDRLDYISSYLRHLNMRVKTMNRSAEYRDIIKFNRLEQP